ncbi:MAG: MgtC/SapB family protein [Halobacteriaceae archaeon]
MDIASWLGAAPMENPAVRLVVSLALGLFLGLEREWSQKAAGIRTFALVSVLGTAFTVYDRAAGAGTDGAYLPLVSAVGVVFVTMLAGGLVYGGIVADEGRNLTTAVGLLISYGVGLLVGIGEVVPATVVAVTSSLLLVLKRELHGFAWGLSREELRSVTEFAILAFVIYPLLPADSISLGANVSIEPRVVWLMVVFVAGLGLVNYVIATLYGGRGIAVTGFFGGLASSTAVVGAVRDDVARRPELAGYGVAAVSLANAAMATRNALIVVLFTASARPLVAALAPLGAAIVGSVAVAGVSADWTADLDIEMETPFSLRNALGFGALFLVVVLANSAAGAEFGRLGLYVTTAIAGLVSSAGAVISVVLLYRTGSLTAGGAVVAVTLATLSSVGVKALLAASSANRDFGRRTVLWSVAVGIAVAASAVAVVA